MAHILVIDDSAEMRKVLEVMLKNVGYEVVSAPDGREGVKLQRANPASLVITDLFMPNQEGLETIREIHKEFPQTPIIAICGYAGASNLLRVASYIGACHTLMKPFQADELIGAVRKVLPSST